MTGLSLLCCVRTGTVLLLLLCLSVCSRLVPPAASPAFGPRADLVGHSSSAQRVQDHPLYQKARQAYKQKDYPRALALLDRLLVLSDLPAEEVAFAQRQRTLCLRTMGHVPAATSPPVSPSPRLRNLDCGPLALQRACREFGLAPSLKQLREWAGTSAQGTSLAGLAKAAERAGLKAEGVQASREALAEVQTPALAWVDGDHFVTVLALAGSGQSATATIHDPNAPGEETIPQEKLLRRCSGYLLLLRR